MTSLRSLRRAETRAFNTLNPPMSGTSNNETTGISIYDWAKIFNPGAQVAFNGMMYQAYTDVQAGIQHYSGNPIIFAVASIRTLLFSEARFQFQQLRNGKPGDLFGTADLQILETPWPGHTTRDLLTRAELDVMGSGQSYWVDNGGYLFRLDPSKVSIMTESVTENLLFGQRIGDKLAGYIYKPDKDPKTWTYYTPEEVCHYMPYPSPNNQFVGQSWLSPCLPDIQVDDTLNVHKIGVLGNGAALSTVVSMDPTISPEAAQKFIDIFQRQHDGPQNAGKTLFLGGGSDVKVVGQTFENLALQATQGASEVRICAAGGVPPAIVGVSEGLKGSSLNAGNYGEARRRLSDVTMRPLWGAFSSSMASLITVPGASRLWYDDAHIAFMREDMADQATILDNNTSALQKLIQSGFEPDAAVDAVQNNDLSRLAGHHTGLTSVQLLPPGVGEPFSGIEGGPVKELPAPAPTNGKTPTPVP
jgi:hypothetical protein